MFRCVSVAGPSTQAPKQPRLKQRGPQHLSPRPLFDMPPNRNNFRAMAAEDQIARLQERAALLQHKDEMRYVIDQLKRHPEHVPKLKKLLENLLRGAVSTGGEASSSGAQRAAAPSAQHAEDQGRLALTNGSPGALADNADDADGIENPDGDANAQPVMIRGRIALAGEAAGDHVEASGVECVCVSVVRRPWASVIFGVLPAITA